MSFLPEPDTAGLSGPAALAARRAETDGPLSDLDRTLLGDLPSFEAHQTWRRLRAELVPYLGERAIALVSLAVVSGRRSAGWTHRFRAEVARGGDDPDDPQVTETERLLIQWASEVGRDAAAVPEDVAARLMAKLTPRLRLMLVAYVSQLVAATVVLDAGRLPASAATPPADSA